MLTADISTSGFFSSVFQEHRFIVHTVYNNAYK